MLGLFFLKWSPENTAICYQGSLYEAETAGNVTDPNDAILIKVGTVERVKLFGAPNKELQTNAISLMGRAVFLTRSGRLAVETESGVYCFFYNFRNEIPVGMPAK